MKKIYYSDQERTMNRCFTFTIRTYGLHAKEEKIIRNIKMSWKEKNF